MDEKFLNPVRGQGDLGGILKKQTSNGVKLTNAVYSLLDFFPESDPLKNRAKDKALIIMENLGLLYQTDGWASLQKEKIKSQILEDIDILLGYLWIAKSQGWLNSVNCMIISNEYEKITKDLKPFYTELTRKLPNIDGRMSMVNRPHKVSGDVLKKEEVSDKEDLLPGYSHNLSLPIVVEDKNTNIPDRQKKIIDFLQKNEKAQVMDLQTVLPDVTKRTIRRDLDDLLESEKIARLGEFNEIFYKLKG